MDLGPEIFSTVYSVGGCKVGKIAIYIVGGQIKFGSIVEVNIRGGYIILFTSKEAIQIPAGRIQNLQIGWADNPDLDQLAGKLNAIYKEATAVASGN